MTSLPILTRNYSLTTFVKKASCRLMQIAKRSEFLKCKDRIRFQDWIPDMIPGKLSVTRFQKIRFLTRCKIKISNWILDKHDKISNWISDKVQNRLLSAQKDKLRTNFKLFPRFYCSRFPSYCSLIKLPKPLFKCPNHCSNFKLS